MVASGTYRHLETLDMSVLHDPAASRGRTGMGSGEALWCAQDRRDGWDILKRREVLWTFGQVDGVEPPNHAVERALRPGVLWRKGSFGT